MPDSELNIVDPARPGAGTGAGDVPERLRRRYLTEAGRGPGLGFYVDATAATPAFRDHGRRLSTDRNDPQVIRDLVAIARHRGWSAISVRGQTGFRREAWIAAQAAGLEVRGYRPSERERQDAARRASRPPPEPAPSAGPAPTGPRAHLGRAVARGEGRMRIVETVVKDRVLDPDRQARILAAARDRIAGWLERGASFEDASLTRRSRADRAR